VKGLKVRVKEGEDLGGLKGRGSGDRVQGSTVGSELGEVRV